jgi:hypothetical protein
MSLEKFAAIFGKGKKVIGKAAETAEAALKSEKLKDAGRKAGEFLISGKPMANATWAAGGYEGGKGLEALLGDDDGDEDDGIALEKYRKRKKSELC